MSGSRVHGFGDVRSLMADRPSARAFESLCEMLEAWPDEGELEAAVLPYVLDHTRRWDPAMCMLPSRWFRELVRGRVRPYMKVARGLSFDEFTLGPRAVPGFCRMLEGFDLVTLDLSGAKMTDDVLGGLLEQPFMRAIRTLCLGNDGISEQGYAALVSHANMSGLERLDVRGSAPLGAAISELALGESLGALEEFRVVGVPLGAQEVEWLSRAAFFGNLRVLGLRSAGVDDDAMRALARAPLGSLRALDLSGSRITGRGIRELVESHQLVGLEELVLDRCPTLGEEGLEWVARSEHLEGLEVLSFSESGGTARVVEALVEQGSTRRLRVLDVSGSELDGASLSALAEAPFAPTLERLASSDCGLGTEAFDGLLALSRLPALASLDISRNTVGWRQWKKLCAQWTFESLRALDVSGCALGKRAFDVVRTAEWARALTSLDMSDIKLESGSLDLPEGSLAALESLKLSGCSLSGKNIASIIVDDVYPSLREFDLSWNSFRGREGGLALARGRWFGQLSRLSLRHSTGPLAVFELLRSGAFDGVRELDVRGNRLHSTGAARQVVDSPGLAGARVLV